MDHIEELRKRIIVLAIFFFIFIIIGLALSPYILNYIIDDFSFQEIRIVSLTPLEVIYTQILIGFIFSLVLLTPFLIFHLLRFISPGTKKKERSAMMLILPSFIILLLVGIIFGYHIFLKISLFFLADISASAGVPNMWSLYKLISFSLTVCLMLGILFQMPLLFIILGKLGLIRKKTLKNKRPYIYVSIFIVAALLTPPDVITQVLIALPVIILYELTVLFL